MSLKLRESWHVTDKYREKRRGRRMNSRVPVRLEWDDGTGKRVSVEAHTRIVNPYGCMVVLQQSLNLEHRLRSPISPLIPAMPPLLFGRAIRAPTVGNTA